jgi:Cupin
MDDLPGLLNIRLIVRPPPELSATVQLILAESAAPGQGSTLLSARLAEILLVHAPRAHSASGDCHQRGNPAAFMRAFTRIQGVGPGAYRRAHRAPVAGVVTTPRPLRPRAAQVAGATWNCSSFPSGVSYVHTRSVRPGKTAR